MNSSRPLLLIVVTLCLVLLALAAFWLAAMPHQLLSSLKRNVESESGFILEATSPRLSFEDGLALKLESVSLGNNSSTSLFAESMQVKTRFATLFGGGFSAEDISFHKAVITVDVAQAAELPKFTASRVVFTESSLRMRDEQRLGVISLSDVNGTLAILANGSAKADVNFLLSDRFTTFSAEAENAERFFTTGSPADITLTTAKMLVGFSGQAKLSKGITLTGQSNIEAEDTATLLRWLGMPLDAINKAGRFRLLSGVSTQGLSAQFDNISATLGRETMTGKAQAAVGPDRMSLSGELEVSRVALFPPQNLLAQPWSEAPLAIADVTAVNLDLQLKAKVLLLRGVNFGAVTAQIKTNSNRTTILLPPQPLAGGTGDVAVAFTQDRGALTVEANINCKAVEAKTVLGGVFGFDALQGPIDFSASTKMQGNSLAALVSSVSGTAKLSAKALVSAGGEIASRLSTAGTGWAGPTGTVAAPIQLEASAQLSEGVALFDRLSVKSGNTWVKPRGEIDVLRQAMALQLAPKLTLTGPWITPTTAAGELPKDKSAVTPPAN